MSWQDCNFLRTYQQQHAISTTQWPHLSDLEGVVVHSAEALFGRCNGAMELVAGADKGCSKAPRDGTHRTARRLRQATQLPRQNRCEEEEHTHGKAGAQEEVVLSLGQRAELEVDAGSAGPLRELLGVVDEVISIGLADVERAREFVLGVSGLSARDALHAAVMARNSIELIMTFDPAFDAVPGIRRFRLLASAISLSSVPSDHASKMSGWI